MRIATKMMHRSLGSALAAALVIGMASTAVTPADAAPAGASQPVNTLNLSTGRGTLVTLSSPMSDLFVANEGVADVQVRSPTQLYIFAKGPGETTVYATTKSGAVAYSANVRVGQNISTVASMLQLAMPDATIEATPMNGLMLLTGTVASPDDAAEAERLAQAFVGAGTQVLSRLKTATPLQVNLQVQIAEVSRGFSKSVGLNLLASGGGFVFQQGRANALTQELNPLTPSNPNDLRTVIAGTGTGSTIGMIKNLLGVNVQAALDLAETDGYVTTLANPNLTALSGETASFLAGGEIPIPLAQTLGQITIEYKQYGVSLAFTPTVLADGRISMRVRPEVSELSTTGGIRLNNFDVPGILTRRAETTVELGSGQSFMIGGLLSNTANSTIDKAPFLGDLPILGALFRSKSFRRQESELVIVVTPYLVKPVSANQIALPTDGARAPNDAEGLLLGESFKGTSGAKRALPSMGNPQTVQPGTSIETSAALPIDELPAQTPPERVALAAKPGKSDKGSADAAPGFTFN